MVTAARRKVILAILLDVENAVGLEKIRMRSYIYREKRRRDISNSLFQFIDVGVERYAAERVSVSLNQTVRPTPTDSFS
jgi:hypothetical protein